MCALKYNFKVDEACEYVLEMSSSNSSSNSSSMKKKGRPSKSKKVLELSGEDLFASLVMSTISKVDSNEVDSNEVDSVKVNSANDSMNKNKSDLAAKKKEKEFMIAAEKNEKIMLMKKMKQEKADLLASKKAEAKAEKDALVEAKKLEKASNVKSNVKSKDNGYVPERPSPAFIDPPVSEEEADVVKKIDFEGKKYLKSKKTGIVYNMEQDVIGKWNEEKQRIDFQEEEESEDEYDEDN